jgi:hypothetical protein
MVAELKKHVAIILHVKFITKKEMIYNVLVRISDNSLKVNGVADHKQPNIIIMYNEEKLKIYLLKFRSLTLFVEPKGPA